MSSRELPAVPIATRRVLSPSAACFVLAVVTIMAYLPSAEGTWAYDDNGAILNNSTIRHIGTALFPPAQSGLPVGGRPVVNFSLALNYALSGTRIWSYHLFNLLIHLGAAVLLFGIVRRTMDRRARRAAGVAVAPETSTYTAFAIALLWAVHPLQTAAVVYVVQRAESLVGLFYLLTLYTFIRSVDDSEADSPVAKRRWLAGSVAACLAGMATKEVMVSAPLVVWLYDRTFWSGGFAAAFKARWQYYGALAATWVLLVGLVAANGGRGGTATFGVQATTWSYALVQVRAHLLYLKLALWPQPLVFDYGLDRVPFEHAGLAAGLILTLLLATTIYGLWRRSAFGFLGAVYFAVLAPSSSVVPVITEIVAEHRMYLSSAALLTALVLLVTAAIRHWRVALAVGAAGFTFLTAKRTEDYHSAPALWADSLAKWPHNARGHFNLGHLLLEQGDPTRAFDHFAAAIAIRPAFPSALHGMCQILLSRGDYAEARRRAEQAIAADPSFAVAHNDLASALLFGGDATSALREFEAAVRLAPDDLELRCNYGAALSQLNRLPEARQQYETALRTYPQSTRVRFALANIFARDRQYEAAIAEYEIVLRLDPKYPRAAENLARVRAMLGPATPSP